MRSGNLKVGDAVVCIEDPETSSYAPRWGEIYEVIAVEKRYVRVTGHVNTPQWAHWRADRFELLGDVR